MYAVLFITAYTHVTSIISGRSGQSEGAIRTRCQPQHKGQCWMDSTGIVFLFKHWIAFCGCSRTIWIALERKANWMHRLGSAWKFAFLSDAIHMARENPQNAIQYLYLHLFTTKFVAVLLTLTQNCHISQVSNVQKVRHLEQPAGTDDELNKAVVWSSVNNTNKRLIFLKFDYCKYSNILLLYKSRCHLLLKCT